MLLLSFFLLIYEFLLGSHSPRLAATSLRGVPPCGTTGQSLNVFELAFARDSSLTLGKTIDAPQLAAGRVAAGATAGLGIQWIPR
ncbi:hypothetical protein HY411_00835 [Candidatus Gottesmanbacteria bacterium]|nr:hypothetical protein [Candidatus Gottesmanbacteria bacterium]